MLRYTTFLAVIVAALALWLTGCSDHAAPSAASAAFTVEWPERSRVIPLAANSLKFTVTDTQGLEILPAHIANRPQDGSVSSVVFHNLPVGIPVTFTVTAYPEAGAQGIAQAIGSTTVTGKAGERLTTEITMASTVDYLNLSTENQVLSPGQQTTITVEPRDGAKVVLVSPQALQWTTSDPDVCTVDEDGVVTAVAPGLANMTVTDTESGKAETIYLVVSTPTSSIQGVKLDDGFGVDLASGDILEGAGDVFCDFSLSMDTTTVSYQPIPDFLACTEAPLDGYTPADMYSALYWNDAAILRVTGADTRYYKLFVVDTTYKPNSFAYASAVIAYQEIPPAAAP